MSKLRACALMTIVVACAVAPGAAQGAGWSTPAFPLTGARNVAAAMNARGDLVVAANDTSAGTWVTERPAGGAFDTPVKLGSAGAYQADVAINAAGDVAVAWDDGSGKHLAVRPRGGSFGATKDFLVSGGSVDFVDVGIDDAGDAVLAWPVTSGSYQLLDTVVRAADGTFGPIVSTAGGGSAGGSTDLAIDGAGDAVVATTRSDGTNTFIQAATRAPGANQFSAFTSLSAAGQSAGAPDTAIDDSGQAVVAWERSDGSYDRVQVAYHSAGAVWSVPTDASLPYTNADYPGVGLDDSGNVLVAWTTGGSALTRPGRFGAPFGASVTQYTTGGGRPSVAVARGSGDAVVAWGTGSQDLYAATGPDTGPLTTSASLASGIQAFGNIVMSPAVADAAGDGALAFSDGTNQIGVTIDDETPPELRGLNLAVRGPAGTAMPFSVAPWDAFSAVGPPRWDFGDGTGATGPSVTHAYAAAGTYTVTVSVTDAAGNTASQSGTVTVAAVAPGPGLPPSGTRPPATTTTRVVCKVPSLKNLTTSAARKKLTAAHCALGRVTTPKKDKKRHGLVIRAQSRRAGTRTTAGAKVNVTLGVRPKPKPRKKTSKSKH